MNHLFRPVLFAGLSLALTMPAPQVFAEEQESTEKAPVRRALDKSISVDIDGQTFQEAVAQLSKLARVPITIDTNALKEDAVALDEPVSFRHPKLTLRSALNLMLRPMECTAVVKDRELQITTWTVSEELVETRDYAIGRVPPDQLAEIIILVLPEQWTDDGGLGEIVAKPGSLKITQTQRMHDQVAELLDGMARHFNPRQPIKVRPHEKAEAQLARKVLKRQRVEFASVPLSDALASLEKQCKIPFFIDTLTLENEGIAPDAAVSYAKNRAPLAEVLTAMLEPLEMAWVIDDEAVIIMSKVDAEAETVLVLYDASRIIGRKATEEQLMESLLEQKDLGPWLDNDGEGGSAESLGTLVMVNHFREQHKKIAKWLKSLE